METSLKELPDSRVRVEVEVPAEDVERAASRAARAMAKEMRMPGFRKGKAPPSLVIQRLGFGPVLRGGDPRGAARVVRTGAARHRDQPDRRPQHRDGLDPRGRGPEGRYVTRVLLDQFGGTGCPKVLEQLWPRCQAGPPDDLLKLAACASSARGHDSGSRQTAAELPRPIRKPRPGACAVRGRSERLRLAPFMVCRFGAVDGHLVLRPVDVCPTECQRFARAA